MSDSPTVTIRGQQTDDWEQLYALLNEPTILRASLDDLPYMAEDTFREHVNAPAANAHTLIAETGQPSGRKHVIGVAWLEVQRTRRRHLAELSLVVHPDYRGSDAEHALLDAALNLADQWLALQRIEVIVYADDDSALSFYEQHGFEREALMPRFVFRAGEYSTAVMLARRHVQFPAVDTHVPAPPARLVNNKEGRLAITVRGCEVDDWEDVAAIRDSGNVAYYTLQLPYMTRESVRERLENLPDGSVMLAAVVKDRVVGQSGLQLGSGRRAHVARLGMMVHADYQGRGVGSALMAAAVDLAENWLNISRIELEYYTDNVAARALYEKFGFALEGTLHDYAFRAGHYIDAYLMARIRSEE
jgi:putative acetyltransferase